MREMNTKKWFAVEFKHIQKETDYQTNMAADQERAWLISLPEGPRRASTPAHVFATFGC